MNTQCTHINSTGDYQLEDTTQTVAHKWRSTKDALRSLLAPIRYLKKRYEQRVARQAFNNLLRLDDHMLKDVGVTRMDVQWASNLPLSQDAATQLEIIARR